MPGPSSTGCVYFWAGGRAGPGARTLRDLEHGKTEAQRGVCPAGTPQRVTLRPGLEPRVPEGWGGRDAPRLTAA